MVLQSLSSGEATLMADEPLATKAAADATQSLRQFLALVVFLSIVVPAVITGFLLMYKNVQSNIVEKSKITAERYATLLQAGMSVPVWNVSPALGQPLIDSLVIDPAVLSIKVISAEQELFLDFDRGFGTQGKNKLSIIKPIVYRQENVGKVELTYSLAQAAEYAAKESLRLGLVILIQLIISLTVLSYCLRKRVMAPLQNLRQFAVGIASGDLKTTAPRIANDEFGELSSQLELMRGAIENNIAHLEERVEQRTSELSIMNAAVTGTLEQLKEAQGNLIQSEKLAALGALVAGIAHELNTPIGNGLTVATTLVQSTSAFKAQLAAGITRSGLQSFVDDVSFGSDLVCRNLEKASELVSGFKQVAIDRTSAQRRKFNLNQFLQDTYVTMTPVFRHTPYQVVISCADDIDMNSYPGPLSQVIVNFLNNALIHAFDGRDTGNIIISAQLNLDTIPPAVDITIVDDGVGISPDHITKIFDPFFTTKLGAGGSGLGMHIVHNIVTGILGGNIEVVSTLGVGTQFTLHLLLEAPLDASAAAPNVVPSPTSFNYSAG